MLEKGTPPPVLPCCNMSYGKSLISLHQRYLPNKPKELDENIFLHLSFNKRIFFRVNKITWGNYSFRFILTTSHLKRFIWTSREFLYGQCHTQRVSYGRPPSTEGTQHSTRLISGQGRWALISRNGLFAGRSCASRVLVVVLVY